MLKAESITIDIDKKQIVKDVSFEINQSEIVCLIGPNGSGKSTILKALTESISLSSGSIVRKGDANIIPVFQGIYLWPHLTADQNIKLALNYSSLSDIKKNETYSFVYQKFQLEKLKNKFPDEMSGGEKQRVGIARAIVLKPTILLLDEITSALDVEQIKFVADVLIDLKKMGVGILFITHHIGLAEKISDRFLFIDDKRLIASGSISEIRQSNIERLNTFLEYV